MHSARALLRSYRQLTADELKRLFDAKWKVIDGRLFKRYALPSHTAAANLAYEVAQSADAMGHHPEIHIRYRYASFTLRSNDADTLSDKDEKLAYIIDDLREKYKQAK